MLSIKSIVCVDSEDYLASVAKVRGHRQIVPGLLKQLERHYRPGSRFLLGMVTGNADPADRAELRRRLTEHFPDFEAIYEGLMGGVLGAYLGPGLLGAGIIQLPDLLVSIIRLKIILWRQRRAKNCMRWVLCLSAQNRQYALRGAFSIK